MPTYNRGIMCLAVTMGSWVNIDAENVTFADAGETLVYQYTVSAALLGLLRRWDDSSPQLRQLRL